MQGIFLGTHGAAPTANGGNARRPSATSKVLGVLGYVSIGLVGVLAFAYMFDIQLPEFFNYLLMSTTAGAASNANGDNTPPTDGDGKGDDADGDDDPTGDDGEGDDGDDDDDDAIEVKDPKALLRKNRELLANQKKLKAKLKEKEDKEKADREKALKDSEDHKALAEIREQERDEALAKLAEYDERFAMAKKITAFREALGPKVNLPSKFVHLVPDEDIVIDPDTGEVDEGSVTKAVRKFRKEFPEVLVSGKDSSLPANAPGGDGDAIVTYEAWLKMSPKDKKKNYKAAMKHYKEHRQQA